MITPNRLRLRAITHTVTAISTSSTLMIRVSMARPPRPASSGFRPRSIAARASACVAVGLAKKISTPTISSLTATSVKPACSIRPSRISPAPSVSITLAACMRV